MIRKLLKYFGLTLLVLLLLLLGVITVAVNYLRPEKLTPIAERYANEYLDADVKIGRIEISFWSTFPRFDLDIRALDIRTCAFDSLPPEVKAQLPAYADSLLSLASLDAGINIPRLLTGDIALYDITIDSPRANLVQATPECWSLDIFPKSEDKPDGGPLEIPDLSIGTFRIDGGFPVRYLSLPDSIDVAVSLLTTRLEGEKAPVYSLAVDGLTSADIASVNISRLKIGIGGDINWSARRPLRTSLSDFKLSVGDVEAVLNTTLDFEKDLRVEALDITLPPTPLRHFIALIPERMRGELDKVDPRDLAVGFDVRFTRPYAVGVDSLPSFDLRLKVPDGSVSYDGMTLDNFELQADAAVDGLDLDRSVISISRLYTRGEGMGFTLTGNATQLIADPKVNGTFRGGLSVQHLPKALLALLPCEVKGLLKADCDFDLRKSWLDKENFHYIRLKGDASLSGLLVEMPELPLHIYSRDMELKFGANSSFVRDGVSVDSMLTASLKIDTLSCMIQDIDMRGRGLRMGVGCRNTASSADTTIINPIGGRIVAERFSFRSSADSTRVHLRDATIGAALQRYRGAARQPQLRLNIATGTALYGDRINRAMLGDARMTLTVHPSSSAFSQRRWARRDSLRRAHPKLSADSITALANAIARAERAARRPHRDSSARATADGGNELEVDRSLRRILRNWQAEGSLRAERMRMFTPLFPLRNRITGLSVDFSTDSIHIHETHVNVGHSDFTLDGSISNISGSLTSRRGYQPLVAMFNLTCDSININEIAGAVFAGAAFADRDTSGAVTLTASVDENADETALQSAVNAASASVDSTSVLIIPTNLEATFNIRANHVTYSDLSFRDFRGTLNAFGGALNLSQLGARSDIGAVRLNALYTAPTKHDASFAFGMQVDGFRIAEFLDLVPAIDTLMPLLHGIGGVINADIAATTALDSAMNIDIPSLKAAIKVSGDSLVVMDDETFRKIGKWLLFKHKERNMIDSMTVEMIVDNSQMQMFPFMFNLDRYRLGIMGNNDLAMNFNYHIAVLKSPLPFKFGINVSGNPDNMKIRLGKAKFSEKSMARTISIADTTRVNLVQQIRNVFRRGVNNARVKNLNFHSVAQDIMETDLKSDTISSADSLYFIREGLLPAPDTTSAPVKAPAPEKNKKRKK